jgi:hypothetical protein
VAGAPPEIVRIAELVTGPPRLPTSTGASAANALSRFLIMDLAENTSPAQALTTVRQLASIEQADSVTEDVAPAADPTDPLWSEQWPLHEIGGNHCSGTIAPVWNSSIHMSSAWDTPTQGPAPLVGIIDSGINVGHVELNGLVSPGRSFAPYFDPTDADWGYDSHFTWGGHGTPVASIAAALTDNGYGMASTSRSATPVSLKWWGSNGGGWPAVVQCIYYADSIPLPILNMSLSGDAAGTEALALTVACKAAFKRGVLLIGAAGNAHDSAATYPGLANDFVTAVGAVLWNNKYWTAYNAGTSYSDSATGSKYGSWVDLVAPGGVGITAAWSVEPFGPEAYWTLDAMYPGQQYACDLATFDALRWGFGGTSAASPFVSGLAAWLLQVNPSLTAEDIVHTMERTATDLGAPGFDVFFANGRIDGARATAYVTSPNWLEHGDLHVGPSGLHLLGDSVSTSITISHAILDDPPGPADGTYACVRYHIRGTAQLNGAFSVAPTAWVRRASSKGMPLTNVWDSASRAQWGGIVGTPSATQLELETYVYRLVGASVPFYPVPPESASVAYSAIGPSGLLGVAEAGRGKLQLSMRSTPIPARSPIRFVVNGTVAGPLKIEVFDIVGRRVATPFEGSVSGSQVSASWDTRSPGGAPWSSGVFLCRATQPGRIAVCRAVVIR